MGSVMKKLVIGLVVGGVLFGVTKALDFPMVFQMLFVAYAMLGAAVFILLDAPSLKPMSGVKAVAVLVVFYVVLCVAYIAGASLWPQYDPEDEKGKIDKILKPKRALTEQGKADELIARAKALDEKVKALSERLKALGGDQAPQDQAAGGAGSPPASGGVVAAGDVARLGEEQWQLQECYNCHKLKGEGGKKRGPELDNIGSYMTTDEIKQKILEPRSWMAEGFEKEYEKKKMPDKYKDLMEDKDVEVLSAWLSSMKNASVNTPKPIKKK